MPEEEASVLDGADHHRQNQGPEGLGQKDQLGQNGREDLVQKDLEGQNGLEVLADQLVAERNVDDSATAEEGHVAGLDDLENRCWDLHEKEGLLAEQEDRPGYLQPP